MMDDMIPFAEFNELIGLGDINALAAKYAPAAQK
jgi:hypothetical protein